MAKKSEKVDIAATETTVKMETTPVDQTDTTTPPPTLDEPTNALVVAPAPSDDSLALLSDAQAQANALAERLPAKYRADVKMSPRPSPEQLVDTVLALPANDQEKMMEIVRKANPKKQGAHAANTAFAPTPIILFHGIGKDETRPKTTIPGNFYTKDSNILGDKFEAAVIGFYEGRIMWPPRGAQGGPRNGQAPANGEAPQKFPLCVSFDQKEGSRYGVCAQCPNSTKPYNQDGCTPEVTLFLINREMTSVFELKMSKTSYGAGTKLVKILQKSENIWDRWISFESTEKTEGDYRWFIMKAAPIPMDPKDPSKSLTPKHLHKLFSNLSKVIDHDVYYPGLASVYDRSKNGQNGANGSAAKNFNPSALLDTAATAGDNPDYSTDA